MHRTSTLMFDNYSMIIRPNIGSPDILINSPTKEQFENDLESLLRWWDYCVTLSSHSTFNRSAENSSSPVFIPSQEDLKSLIDCALRALSSSFQRTDSEVSRSL